MALIVLIVVICVLRAWWKSTEYPEWKDWSLEEWMQHWDDEKYGR